MFVVVVVVVVYISVVYIFVYMLFVVQFADALTMETDLPHIRKASKVE